MKIKKAIAMTAYGRPEYLAKTLLSLREAWKPGWAAMFVRVDPGPLTAQVLTQFALELPLQVFIAINQSRHLDTWNTFRALDYAFEESEFVLMLEDDILLSRDALLLVDWYIERGLDKHSMAVCLHSDSKSQDYPKQVVMSEHFDPWGWGISRNNFLTHLAPNWMSNPKGWDYSVLDECRGLKMEVVRPVCSRTRHIGEEGQHMRKAFHDEVYGECQRYTGEPVSEFIFPNE